MLTKTPCGQVQILFEKADELGWFVSHECDNIYRFSKSSPAGQDFGIEIDTEGEPGLLLENLLAANEDYDVSEEAYLWLGEDGHGKNGAPYDMRDVYEDMEACKDMLGKLCDALHNYYYEEIYEESKQ